jgi:hypothetical protein
MYYIHKYHLANTEYEAAMKRLHDNNPCRQTFQHRKAAKRAEKSMWKTLHGIRALNFYNNTI